MIINNLIIALIVGLLLALFGNLYHTHFSLGPKIDNLASSIDSLKTCISPLQRDVHTMDNHVLQRPHNGIPCKVGANFQNKGYIASVYSNNPFGLKNQDHITIYYHHNYGGSFVHVTIVMDSGLKKEKDTADIYLSEECFKILGISKQRALKRGVFDMTYKIPEEKYHS